MPPALVEAEEIPSALKTIPSKVRDYSHLKKYHFQPGHAPLNGVGRPKGVKNAQTILLKSAPRLARSYVKKAMTGDSTLLADARKWILPTDGDAVASPTKMVVFIGDMNLLPRERTPLPVVAVDHSECPELPNSLNDR